MPVVDGVPYDQVQEVDGELLLHTAIHAVLASTLLYGASHGDLHAGNVLVPAPDRFNLLDAVVGVVLELAEAHPEEFAAAELEEAAAG